MTGKVGEFCFRKPVGTLHRDLAPQSTCTQANKHTDGHTE